MSCEYYKYLLVLGFNQAFQRKKVTVVKVLRALFGLTLYEAKEVADDYVCLESNEIINSSFRNVEFIINPSMFANAMFRFTTHTVPDGKLDDGVLTEVFHYIETEIVTDNQPCNLTKY